MENVIIQLLICLIGLFGLFYGGEKLVTGSVNTASFFKVKPQFVAITIIALGTSFPELVVSVNAVVDESPGIAWGNVLGSNISNILFSVRKPDFFEIIIDIEVRDANHLQNIIAALRMEKEVSSLERLKG
mgnify:CR=1 FL=1